MCLLVLFIRLEGDRNQSEIARRMSCSRHDQGRLFMNRHLAYELIAERDALERVCDSRGEVRRIDHLWLLVAILIISSLLKAQLIGIAATAEVETCEY